MIDDRRPFVVRLAVVLALSLAAGLAAFAQEAPSRYAQALALDIDGATEMPYVLYNPSDPPEIPPLAEWMEVRVHSVFPYEGRDLLWTEVYVASKLDASHAKLFAISEFTVQVDDVILGTGPADTIAFFGTCVANPLVSPFGEIVGRAFAFSGEFSSWRRPQAGPDDGDVATVEFWGVVAAGSHATFVPVATGTLEIRRPWHSY